MLRDQLGELLGPVVAGLGYELWEIEYAPRAGGTSSPGSISRYYQRCRRGPDCAPRRRRKSLPPGDDRPLVGRHHAAMTPGTTTETGTP